MDHQEIKRKILAVLATLDEIDVCGRKSVGKMAAVMQYLEAMAEEMDKPSGLEAITAVNEAATGENKA